MVSAFVLAVFTTFYPLALPSCLYGMMAIALWRWNSGVGWPKMGKYTPKLKNNKSLAGSFVCFFFSTLAMVVVSLMFGINLNNWCDSCGYWSSFESIKEM